MNVYFSPPPYLTSDRDNKTKKQVERKKINKDNYVHNCKTTIKQKMKKNNKL